MTPAPTRDRCSRQGTHRGAYRRSQGPIPARKEKKNAVEPILKAGKATPSTGAPPPLAGGACPERAAERKDRTGGIAGITHRSTPGPITMDAHRPARRQRHDPPQNAKQAPLRDRPLIATAGLAAAPRRQLVFRGAPWPRCKAHPQRHREDCAHMSFLWRARQRKNSRLANIIAAPAGPSMLAGYLVVKFRVQSELELRSTSSAASCGGRIPATFLAGGIGATSRARAQQFRRVRVAGAAGEIGVGRSW